MLWLEVGEVVALVAVLVIGLPVCWLILRRRWLGRSGGLFDCSLRLHTTTPSAGWVLGVARYRGDRLEWFRTFSASLRPRMAFERSETRAGRQRLPDPVEALALLEDQRIIRLDAPDGQGWELSMSDQALLGLLSWLEAAPPGQGHQRTWHSPTPD
ncbi:MAG: DUF2550 domain-containing protein [Propionicimonas sp.]|uniref:DUF2550 domain-containing protein n=1 Tax=Propionicimonas sp. TaxID=1955623 RepID=UPI002B20BA16|nr:DUF2550 domain-containing protein [Propionicimonas sp.]MEA4943160.1 DUF2550 domain-containing protein [Propionicimonas sp.]MEA5054766.1 DUF2550 domain-containing protein [Propionicimonas sp.]